MSQPAGGRFPRNDIISLLDVNRSFNLAESTASDLRLGEVIDLVGIEAVRDIRLGYGSSRGLPALREAVARRTGVSAEEVLATQGTALGIALLALELCAGGGDTLLLTPCFPPARDMFVGVGTRVRELRLTFDDGYRIDLQRFAEALTPSLKLVCLASPQNPTGIRTDAETVAMMLALMAARAPQALLFVDETYRESTYGSALPPASVAALDPRVVTGGSLSKAHGAPGLRAGWLTVRDRALMERLTTAKMNLVISGSPLDETLAAALLERSDAILEPRRAMLARALEKVESWHRENRDQVDWLRPEGGALCVMRLRPDLFDDAAVATFWGRLPSHDLQLASGTWFGETGRIFRLGFGYLPLEELNGALAALSAALEKTLFKVSSGREAAV